MTDEQKKQQQELKAETAKLRATIKEQIHAMLTDEQKVYYKIRKPKQNVSTASTKILNDQPES